MLSIVEHIKNVFYPRNQAYTIYTLLLCTSLFACTVDEEGPTTNKMILQFSTFFVQVYTVYTLGFLFVLSIL